MNVKVAAHQTEGSATARSVARVVRGMPTSDGAGVKLTRVIGQPGLADLDPFLLLDEFGTENPDDYIAGFPEHPHRGFETVTYMLDGRMRHRDNHGHEGVLGPGGVQWMTAGRGILHSEMPEQQAGRMRGFQLWINLPARDKMVAPRYQEFGPEKIPVATPAPGVHVKVIAGQVGDVRGPITQPATDPLYLDVELAPGARFTETVPADYAAFVYVFEGSVTVGTGASQRALRTHELAVLSAGDRVQLEGAAGASSRAILVAGKPLGEPVAKYGPFVMNTREELARAFEDLQSGRF
ncbi:MAG TPA: pirin family protein [Steroidobacteraceae bacterium]|nr:pirin family protein [Steroidobacteraceae bacterium]